jgi:hypothetical protein
MPGRAGKAIGSGEHVNALPVLLVLVLFAAGCDGTTETVNVTTTETITETVTKTVAPPARVFVPALEDRLVYMPDSIASGASAAIYDIHWKSYGGPTAIGSAIFPSNDCTPSCAEGTITRDKVTVKLSQRILCRGVLVYELLALEGPGYSRGFDQNSNFDPSTDC